MAWAFASALAELGLSREALVDALIGFNIGVELGQLAFVVSSCRRSSGHRGLAAYCAYRRSCREQWR